MRKVTPPMMATAEVWAKESKCERRKVGCVISKDSRIVSTGYNGNPSGMPNCCESDGNTMETVLHAEQNALMFAAKEGISTKGCTLYVTLSPCLTCATLIIQAGITKVIYKEEYRDTKGIKLLNSMKVICLPMVNS